MSNIQWIQDNIQGIVEILTTILGFSKRGKAQQRDSAVGRSVFRFKW